MPSPVLAVIFSPPDKDPRRPNVTDIRRRCRVVSRTAYDGGVAVAGQRDGGPLCSESNRAGADKLAALLGPKTLFVAGKDPHRTGVG